MPKDKSEKFKALDVKIIQGMRSRWMRFWMAIEAADDLTPVQAEAITNQQINDIRLKLAAAQQNLEQFVAYRKMAGLDDQ
ncbi:MAG: hypothetical protein ACPG61_18245 [Paracoccaceae bacterium]